MEGDLEETQAWRKLKVIIYFPDTLNAKVIYFVDGNRGSYYFFFEGPYLAKARFYDLANKKEKSYQYSKEENQNNEPSSFSKTLYGLPGQDRQTILKAALGLKLR